MEKVKGIVSKGKNQPIQLTEVVLPDLGKHDVKVKIVSCGVCHTDLAYVEGGINDDYPFLLGHEAAGIVEKIGSDVVHVQVGDTVILNWRAVCGECRSCKKGKPEYCFNTLNAENKMTLSDGTVLTPALGIGAFIEKTVVNEKQCTKIVEDVDLNAAGLLGCGVMAGIGAVINTGKVSRGDKVAVFGLGGVGMAAVAAANLAGATQIIAVDNKPEKLELAKKFGATNLLNVNAFPEITHIDSSVQNSALVKKIHEISGGFGVDVAVDAVGTPLTFLEAFYARDLAGTVVLVGVPTPTMKLNIDLLDVFSHGGNIKSSWYGDCLPERDFPMLIDLYNQGKFPLGCFVTEVTSLDQVEEAFTKMKQGKVLRSVVRP